jgi:predicted nuclease of predicted toxin-antitoxin system
MKFIVDTQLPFKLSMFLKRNGHDCIHTTDTMKGHLLQDSEIVTIAIENDRTVVTKDSDFKDNYHSKGAPPKVLYLTFGNISNKDLLAYFELYLGNIIIQFETGVEFIEFNREGIFVSD